MFQIYYLNSSKVICFKIFLKGIDYAIEIDFYDIFTRNNILKITNFNTGQKWIHSSELNML